MNHLDNIANRQRTSRVRDVIFAGFVALGAVVSVATISTAASVANTSHAPTAVTTQIALR